MIVGAKDRLFLAEMFEPTIHAVRPGVSVTLLPDLDHIQVSTDPRAIPAILGAVRGAS